MAIPLCDGGGVMAWGMLEPLSSGRYRLEGEREGLTGKRPLTISGFQKRLQDHFLAQPPEIQKQLFDYEELTEGERPFVYYQYVRNSLTSERGTRREPRWPLFRPLLSHEVPRFYECVALPSAIINSPDRIGSLVNLGSLAVDADLKAIIERLEPDIHEFYPIELRLHYGSGKIVSRDFFTLFIGQYFDSFVPERTDPEIIKNTVHSGYILQNSKAGVNGLALDRNIYNGAHLWKERNLAGNYPICFSDELRSAIAEAGLAIPKLYRMRGE